ncbi:hypothetical protein B0H19DRAFT_967915, partial [Mycena capillaripes]
MRKMVNSMSAKMEIGSPMASMYLLGNPDHYTSHNYVPFAWRQYVQFVRDFWVDSLKEEEEEDEDEAEGLGRDDEERVRIGRMGSNFVPSSSVDDYRYRPTVYFNMNLYEWIQCSSKRKRSARERTNFEENIRKNDGESDWETDDEDDVILDKEAKRTKTNKSSYHPFMPPHSLFRSHCATCNFDNTYTMIPNFIGGSIPRSDKGDRAAYCMTMLTLFKPWRSPSDLKDNISTWDQAFKEHKFTERQSQLIKNFDVRYECNDARDDH